MKQLNINIILIVFILFLGIPVCSNAQYTANGNNAFDFLRIGNPNAETAEENSIDISFDDVQIEEWMVSSDSWNTKKNTRKDTTLEKTKYELLHDKIIEINISKKSMLFFAVMFFFILP